MAQIGLWVSESGTKAVKELGPECCQAAPAPTPDNKRWQMMPATPALGYTRAC